MGVVRDETCIFSHAQEDWMFSTAWDKHDQSRSPSLDFADQYVVKVWLSGGHKNPRNFLWTFSSSGLSSAKFLPLKTDILRVGTWLRFSFSEAILFPFLPLEFSCCFTMNPFAWVNESLTYRSWVWQWPCISLRFAVQVCIAWAVCVCVCAHAQREFMLALSCECSRTPEVNTKAA